MSDQYPTGIYHNKLLNPQYLKSENKVPSNTLDYNVEADWLLYTYIVQLDEETFSEMPEGLNAGAELLWVTDQWSKLLPKIADESRKHGWCVVQFYKDVEPAWRVFTIATFSDWMRETVIVPATEDDIETSYEKRVGVKFTWTDDLGNSSEDECLFDGDCFMVKYREGNGQMVYAYPDLSDAVLDIAYNTRQVKGQMDLIGSKPGFKHYVYGASATTTNTNTLDTELKKVDTTTGIGAPKSVLEEIINVADENIKVVIPIYEKSLEAFSGITRLPVSYYTGKNDSGGLSDVGEKTALLQIDRKKNGLFKRYEPVIQQIFSEHYGIVVGDLELPQDETMDKLEENQPSTEDNSSTKEEPTD